MLHTWGQAMTHHPHVHCVVPGGGLSTTDRRGSHVGHVSFCPCACCHACSDGAF
nr:transposase [Sinorhizobium medicae]